ncbi:PREDICTED: cell differentiation protein RCD1 homolog [Erythranthe guttata]|uniref:cell differentiation protein RCD1 homolog n=1 Tax=Erythranthe guttata TaxID=4155 RepID=UPI00064DFA70|nr:PREDICTED: cell differentiation protein RCD1 homolog [Erythranthe guttata]|eukprot:XP_012848357.1 PREDICTED: cell differentiation protein RCD1 homolog [Erythranthe guttata]
MADKSVPVNSAAAATTTTTPIYVPSSAASPTPPPIPAPFPTPVPIPAPIPSNFISSSFTFLTDRSFPSSHRGAVAPPPYVRPGHFVGAPPSIIPPAEYREASRDDLVSQLDNLACLRYKLYKPLDMTKRIVFQDLAPYLWFSFGTIAILFQELLDIYPFLSPPCLSPEQSYRACNVLVLLQCITSHPTTRPLFAEARIPYYLCAILDLIDDSLSEPFEHLRLATLDAMCSLVKVPDTEVIDCILYSEIMPLCLQILQCGSVMSKPFAAFIVEKLLLNNDYFQHICHLPKRLFPVCHALGNVVALLAEAPSAQLLNHVIRCYHRFLDDERSHWTMRNPFPKALTDGTFDHCLREEQRARMLLQQLLDNVRGPPVPYPSRSLKQLREVVTTLVLIFFWRAVSSIRLTFRV